MKCLENPEDEMPETHRYIEWLMVSRWWMAFTAIGFSICGVALNALDIHLPFGGDAVGAATTPLTMLSLTLLAISIIGADRRSRMMYVGPFAAICAIFACMFPHAMEWSGIGTFGSDVFSGKVGIDTSLIITLLAFSVLARYRAPILGLTGGLGATAFLLNALIGQTYGLPYFDGAMASMTLFALICATGATASLFVHRPLIRIMFMSGAIGFRTRVMMAVGFFAPWGCGFVLYHGYGVPDREYHVEAMLISAMIWIMLSVTLASGFLHEKADQERRAAERRLARDALCDALTGLLNRAGLVAQLTKQWKRFERLRVPAAIILIDLDHFKSINDTFGHDMGDRVLKSIRKALTPYLRQDDVVGRWGGEEFLCLLQNTDIRHLQQISERLRQGINAISDLPIMSHGKGPVNVSASIGISCFMKGDHGYEAAIKRADDALYAAKRTGRNRVIFDPALRTPLNSVSLRENALTA